MAPDFEGERLTAVAIDGLARLVRHFDISLVELANETVKQDDRAVLLEGGGLQSVSPKARSSPVTSHVVRSEFGVLLIYFYLCDRTILFGESKKVLPMP
ncbi:Protein REDUCED WALL ACETYLATION 2 [Camellia lanceoleosa]|uniref:Protein REDUCED WALL ACETYLATION 2 n=1 Tax=Camellia lanceoleosa TaxID=1840588 RepID=A0ACC0GSM4_9ERIC|nr:Protein REDUCED WALL ACETYLATION 2 [Camellia lanceoleosa]